MKCHQCDSTDGVKYRKFNWDYRPRRGSRSFEILVVELCERCFSIVYDYSTESNNDYLIGYDWYDAYDGIHFDIEDYWREVMSADA